MLVLLCTYWVSNYGSGIVIARDWSQLVSMSVSITNHPYPLLVTHFKPAGKSQTYHLHIWFSPAPRLIPGFLQPVPVWVWGGQGEAFFLSQAVAFTVSCSLVTNSFLEFFWNWQAIARDDVTQQTAEACYHGSNSLARTGCSHPVVWCALEKHARGSLAVTHSAT